MKGGEKPHLIISILTIGRKFFSQVSKIGYKNIQNKFRISIVGKVHIKIIIYFTFEPLRLVYITSENTITDHRPPLNTLRPPRLIQVSK